jgi:predicted RNase H-like HicB family nuclease
MAQHRQLTAIIEREGDGYVALCPELDIASQGPSIEQARTNLKEAIELFFESVRSGGNQDATARTSIRHARRW